MEQTSVVKSLQSLIKLSRCSARKTATSQPIVEEEQKIINADKDIVATQKLVDDCDGKSDSTESGDVSSDEQVPGSTYGASETTESGDFADSGSTVSEQASVVADASDLDSPSHRCAPSFRPPPGLELFAEESVTEKVDLAVPPGLASAATKLNVEALPFVPTCPMTVPMPSVWEPCMALPIASQWEDPGAAVLNYLACVAEEKPASSLVEEKPFSYVEQAVERMTQEEVAKLKALLDTKDTVKHSISLNDMIIDEKQHGSTTTKIAKVSSRPAPQQSKSSKQGPSRVVKPNETLQQTRPSAALDLEAAPETTLRANLEELAKMDPARVLMLRKINKLGVRAPAMLKDYFSKFGAVDRVMISHSRAKSIYNPSQTRVRIAGLAFVVMSTEEEARAVLDIGREHVVQSVGISVSEFEGNTSVENADGAKVLPGDDHDFNTLD
mmetsp:Transcript_24981/g.39068  ORF Transcript_24981/g.39068 Transcript_24981/m.39068 type:complete len:441 (+) Transcript_24981:132-1454(+)|eukprot:CAMPEP_0169230852 /NCGR_PEP_ID=MMETSP1016-20121227/26167_1 /TAXON_ID=342587 /ORGANISM="Karlodinium micrum, Strain CCMP2283" /LENGTH=440 /DNA_ID=CAMNT_0009309883 /DNA_START=81 /DNA_END=1403 /DNA_ORIENTATION=+